MKTMRCALILLMALALPGIAQGATFWEETFENHLWTGTNGSPWDTGSCDPTNPLGGPPDGCNPFITASIARNGTHSLQGHYTDNGTGNGSGNWIDRSYTPTDEVWTRFYYRTANFTYNNPGTKHIHLGDGVHYPNFWINNNEASRAMRIYGQKVADPQCGTGGTRYIPSSQSAPEDCLYDPNVATVNLNDNQWYCIETHIKMGTPGGSDGRLELWVDNVQTVNYTRALRGSLPLTGPFDNSSLATFNFTRIYVQFGLGEMYYDDFAVGDTRIGCGGVPPTPPPAHPSNLRITLGVLSIALAAAVVLGGAQRYRR